MWFHKVIFDKYDILVSLVYVDTSKVEYILETNYCYRNVVGEAADNFVVTFPKNDHDGSKLWLLLY